MGGITPVKISEFREIKIPFIHRLLRLPESVDYAPVLKPFFRSVFVALVHLSGYRGVQHDSFGELEA